ncbi:MAG TPA: restriction endonuclease subunit S [Candidatus Atribacteria bacterium]|nr:restriction endonuclease subunit S [Candidatus Atribacteria bacterium]
MSFSEWREVALKDVIEFNPKESIKKGTITKKIGMDKLAPFQRKIDGFELEAFKGGSKFRNGDTLLARITPCLENGKTAQVTILDDDEVAFGSTEYIVLRHKIGITDNNYIFYLALSQYVRDTAIKSMTGTSGRQRAQTDVIENTKIMLPPLDEQTAIAHILSTLDDKIEVNNQINKTLENMAQAIFKQWFVDFEFPNEDGEPYKSSGGEMVESELGMIPKGWRVDSLGNLLDVQKGLSYKGKHLVEEGVPMINLGTINPGGGYRQEKIKFYNGDFKDRHMVKPGDLVIANTDMTQDRVILGSPCLVPDFECEKIIFTHHIFAIRNLKIPRNFLYYYFKSKDFRERAEGYATGTTVLALPQKGVVGIDLYLPNVDILERFNELIQSFIDKMNNLDKENELLKRIRDVLLPKLMSGEIRVPLDEEGAAS